MTAAEGRVAQGLGSYRRFAEDTGGALSLADVDVACGIHLRYFDLRTGNDDVTGAW